MSGLVVVEVTPQAPVGVLTWDAWARLREAELVYAPADLDPQWQVALDAADITVSAFPDEAPDPDGVDAGNRGSDAERLLAAARRQDVVWFGSLQADPGLARGLAAELLRLGQAGEAAPAFEQVLGSWPRPGAAVADLVAVMDRLRSPGGCPWDAEQTHASLLPYALEEAFEVAEAVESGGRDDLVEELGDLLLQVVFHARLGQEWEQPFGVDDVAAGITAKLKRRHPHVFADVDAPTAAHVEANWEQIKQTEKGRASVFDGVPVGLPALARADKVLGRFARAGLDPALALGSPAPQDIGGQLLALAARARELGLDPEAGLRAAVRAAEQAGRAAEQAGRAAEQAGRAAEQAGRAAEQAGRAAEPPRT